MPHRSPDQLSKFRRDRKFQNLYAHLRERHFYSPRELGECRTQEDLQKIHDADHVTGEVQDHTHKPREDQVERSAG